MPSRLEYIDDYFNGKLPETERAAFGAELEINPELADEVAFYLSAREALIAEGAAGRKERWRLIPLPGERPASGGLVRRMKSWYAIAAMLLLVLAGTWYLWLRPVPAPVLANRYIRGHLQDLLGTSMDTHNDSLDLAIRYYRDGPLDSAGIYFESLLVSDPKSADLLRMAGLAALRLKQYDRAVSHFSRLESERQLAVNPGAFYHALTLMARDHEGDRDEAKALLEKVVRDNLQGAATASQWLKHWR